MHDFEVMLKNYIQHLVKNEVKKIMESVDTKIREVCQEEINDINYEDIFNSYGIRDEIREIADQAVESAVSDLCVEELLQGTSINITFG